MISLKDKGDARIPDRMRFPDNAFRRGERFQIGETIVEVRQNSRRSGTRRGGQC